MAALGRLYVDTNVFIRLFEANDELAAALADMFLLEPKGSQPFLATSELTLAELIVEPLRTGDARLMAIYDSWTISNPYIDVHPVSRQTLLHAAMVRARYRKLKLPDAIHLASALQMRCSHFLTADTALAGEYELAAPQDGMAVDPGSVVIARPDLTFIQDVIGSGTR